VKGSCEIAFLKGDAMLAILVFGAITGAVLGWRFNVFVLAPATLFFSTVTIATGIVTNSDARTVVVVVLAALTLLQAGYIAGSLSLSIFQSEPNLRRSVWIPAQNC